MSQSDRVGGLADEAQLRSLRAAECAEAGRFAEAEAEFNAVLQLDPSLHTARFQLGLLQLTCANPNEAIRTWRPLHDESAPQPLQEFVRGLEALIEDDFAESMASLENGISLNTANPALNKDMNMLIARIRARLEAETPRSGDSSAEGSNESRVRTDFSLYEK